MYCNREGFMLKQFCLTPSRTEENIFATVEPGGAGGVGEAQFSGYGWNMIIKMFNR